MATETIYHGVRSAIKRTPLWAPLRSLKRYTRTKLPSEISGFAWVKEDETFHTTVHIYNYWAVNYDVQGDFELHVSVHGTDGERLGKATFLMAPDATTSVPTSELLTRCGVDTPFEGTLIYTVKHRNIPPGLPLQGNVDFEYSSGRMTSVHGLGRYNSGWGDEWNSAITLNPKDDEDTFLVVQNPFPFKKSPSERTKQDVVQVFNYRGDKYPEDFTTPLIRACGSATVHLEASFPNLHEFLEGEVGWFRIWSDLSAGRYLTYGKSKNTGNWRVNHLAGAVRPGGPLWYDAESVANLERVGINILPFVSGGKTESEYQIYHGHDTLPEYGLDITIHDDNGQLIVNLPNRVRVPRLGAAGFTAKELLAEAKISSAGESFTGNIVFSISRESSHENVPHGIPIILRLLENDFSADVGVGPDIYNIRQLIDSKPLESIPRIIPRTKTFARIRETDEWETSLTLINQSSLSGYDTTSDTKITIHTPNGLDDLSATVHVPPYGSKTFRIRDLFPDIVTLLHDSGGYGFVKARDLTVRECGFFVIRNLKTGAIASDHLYGG